MLTKTPNAKVTRSERRRVRLTAVLCLAVEPK